MRIFFYTFLTFFRYLFRLDRASILVWEDLLFKFSYRYPEKDKYRYRISLTFLNQAVKKLLFSRKINTGTGSDNILILDILSKAQKERTDYVQRTMGVGSPSFFAKATLPNSFSFIISALLLIPLLAIFIFGLFLSFFYKNKANVALLPVEFVELLQLACLLRGSPPKKIIFFSAYEKDTCYVSNYILKYLDIELHIIPSPNPISNFYQRVISSVFVFTAPYQKIEYETLKSNWLISDLVHYPPPGFTEILHTINKPTRQNTIGYISSGNWLRKKLGHNDPKKGLFEAEENLTEFLKGYLAQHSDIRFYVSLHPLESQNKINLELSKTFYKQQFGNRFEFFPFDIKTRDKPEKFDVAVSAYSSAMFERLFAGYKVMFSQKGMKENYFFDKQLEKITANDYDSFEKLMDKLLAISVDEYFESFKLEEYRNTFFKEANTITSN